MGSKLLVKLSSWLELGLNSCFVGVTCVGTIDVGTSLMVGKVEPA